MKTQVIISGILALIAGVGFAQDPAAPPTRACQAGVYGYRAHANIPATWPARSAMGRSLLGTILPSVISDADISLIAARQSGATAPAGGPGGKRDPTTGWGGLAVPRPGRSAGAVPMPGRRGMVPAPGGGGAPVPLPGRAGGAVPTPGPAGGMVPAPGPGTGMVPMRGASGGMGTRPNQPLAERRPREQLREQARQDLEATRERIRRGRLGYGYPPSGFSYQYPQGGYYVPSLRGYIYPDGSSSFYPYGNAPYPRGGRGYGSYYGPYRGYAVNPYWGYYYPYHYPYYWNPWSYHPYYYGW